MNTTVIKVIKNFLIGHVVSNSQYRAYEIYITLFGKRVILNNNDSIILDPSLYTKPEHAKELVDEIISDIKNTNRFDKILTQTALGNL